MAKAGFSRRRGGPDRMVRGVSLWVERLVRKWVTVEARRGTALDSPVTGRMKGADRGKRP